MVSLPILYLHCWANTFCPSSLWYLRVILGHLVPPTLSTRPRNILNLNIHHHIHHISIVLIMCYVLLVCTYGHIKQYVQCYMAHHASIRRVVQTPKEAWWAKRYFDESSESFFYDFSENINLEKITRKNTLCILSTIIINWVLTQHYKLNSNTTRHSSNHFIPILQLLWNLSFWESIKKQYSTVQLRSTPNSI